MTEFLITTPKILKFEFNNKVPNFHNPICHDGSSIPMDQAKFIKLSNLGKNKSLHLFIGVNNFNSATRERKDRIIDFYCEVNREYTFRECKEIMVGETVIIVNNNIVKWQDITCSCRDYLKTNTCLHVVSMAREKGKEEIL